MEATTSINNQKYEAVKQWFSRHPRILVALSGGVDSCLVAFLARHFLGYDNVVAIIGDSPALKRSDYYQARDFCQQNNIKYSTVSPGEIDDPRYNSNPEDRCFWCKNSLYTAMNHLRRTKYSNYTMVNGSNKSDLADYRPGLKAADEYKVLSPLADCNFKKEDIREMACYFNLKVWDKPASPCLSSRFPYGEGITRKKLKMVEEAEDIINRHGFKEVRARYRSGKTSIEVPPNEVSRLAEMMPVISDQLKKIGFSEVELDKEGLISGKLNREIGK
ncbi:ATP-dependent sacrificial sulfur transferase LarE [Anaerophaga thermohalophila]|uniref:ATP-dependent sacrificial sulfur transferase LarE n=1 Tax=Anaerophaga thermohalophila TaxID=177400 RepID=UPI000237D224|nr:ATP-dependent sacrificial sulfur transferase LarE [Anaerophaga thermohalophila]